MCFESLQAKGQGGRRHILASAPTLFRLFIAALLAPVKHNGVICRCPHCASLLHPRPAPPCPAPPREAGHKEPPVPAPTAQSARSGHPLPPRAPAFPIPPWASLWGLSPLVPDVPPLFIPLETRRGCGYTPTGSGVVLNPQWLRPEALCCQSSEGSASFWALDAERSLSWGLLVPARGLQSSEPQICSGCDPSGGRHTGGLLAGRSPAAAS